MNTVYVVLKHTSHYGDPYDTALFGVYGSEVSFAKDIKEREPNAYIHPKTLQYYFEDGDFIDGYFEVIAKEVL